MTHEKKWQTVKSAHDVALGDVVRDRLSGFSGVAASRVEYLTGCTQIAIARHGLDEKGKPHEWQYFDWQRLEVDISSANQFADVSQSQATQDRNGPGEAPRGRY